MNLLPYLLSFGIGYLSIKAILSKSNPLQPALHVALSVGVGMGISAFLTFLSFIIINEYSQSFIIGTNLGFLLALLILDRFDVLRQLAPKIIPLFKFPQILYSLGYVAFPLLVIKLFYPGLKALSNFLDQGTVSVNIAFLVPIVLLIICFYVLFIVFKRQHMMNLAIWGIWCTLVAIIHFLASRHPFGEWDAWAIYNMKMRFLILSGDAWKDVFEKLHWHTQPDYPLLLPLMNTWNYALTPQNMSTIPLITAVILSFGTCLLLYAGLKMYTSKTVAFLGSSILLFNPYYIYLSTAQYADILLAYFLLGGIICITIFLNTKNHHMAFLTGILFGFMTFTKNEGLAFTAIMFFLLFFYLVFKEKNWRLFRSIFIGLLCGAAFTIFFKLFLAPSNRDILTNLNSEQLVFFNMNGLMITINAIGQEIMDVRWCYMWIFISALVLVGLPKFFRKECGVLTLFFVLYFAVIVFIYLTTTNFDLSWRLTSTLRRIYCYLLPSILFFCFYTHWRTKEQNINYE